MKVVRTLVAAVIVFLCLLRGSQVDAQITASVQPSLVGEWELVSLEDHAANGEISHWLGGRPSGLLIYTGSGRMSVQFMRDPRPTFAAGNVWGPGGELLSVARPDEIHKALAGYYAYFGTYQVDEGGRTVTHVVTASLRPHEIGVKYIRPFELSRDQLVLRYSVATDTTRTRVATFRRATP